MARQGSPDGDFRRFPVADFADHDDIRVVPEDVPKARGERQTPLGVHRHLVDALKLILHRVLDRNHLDRRGVDLIESGVERCGLARARRPGDQDDAMGLSQTLVEPVKRLWIHAEVVKTDQGGRPVQQAEFHGLAEHGGHR